MASDLSKNRTKIKKALHEQGAYTPDMDSAIHLAAGSLMAYNKAIKDIEDLDCVWIEEISREGNKKYVPHPAFRVLASTSEMVRRSLRELRLTLASTGMTTEDDDGINSLVDKVNNVE